MPEEAAQAGSRQQRMVVLHEMISVQNVRKQFGEKTVLENASLEIPDNCVCGIYGESGIGKSTMAKLLCGIYKPEQGEIFIGDQLLVSTAQPYDRKLGLRIQMVYQQPYATLDPRQKIGAGFWELIRYHRLATKGQERELTWDMLEKVGLEPDILTHLPHQISGGEAQRVAIARCILFRPKLLILDEATSMLDVSTQANVLGMIRKIMNEGGGSILLISHDRPLVDFFCDQIYVFDNKTLKKENRK